MWRSLAWCLFCTVCLQITWGRGYGRSSGSSPACDPADPVPLKRIDLNMIKGFWRCHYLKLPKGMPVKFASVSYNLIIGKPFTNGSALSEVRGRSPVSFRCRSVPTFLEYTGEKNTYTVKSSFAAMIGSEKIQWRFLDSFGQYLLGVECIDFDKNDRCLRSFVDVLSRTDDAIPLAVLKKVNQSLRKTMCLDLFEDLLEWPGGNNCPGPRRVLSSYDRYAHH